MSSELAELEFLRRYDEGTGRGRGFETAMDDVRKRFIRGLAEALIQQHGRDAALQRLQRAASRSTGPQRRLTLDMIEAVENLELSGATQLSAN